MRDCKYECLVLLVNERLSGLALWRTKRHLEHCAPCQQALAELTALSQGLRDATLETPSAALIARMQQTTPTISKQRITASSLRLWLPAPAIGMVLGILLALWLVILNPIVPSAAVSVGFQAPPGRAQFAIDEISALRPTGPNLTSGVASWGADKRRADHYWVLLQVRDHTQESNLTLKEWTDRLEHSPKLKPSHIEVWSVAPILGMDVRPKVISSAGISPALALPVGGVVGLLLGLLLSFIFWMLKNVRGKLLIPCVTALLGLLLGPISTLQAGQQHRLTATVEVTSSRDPMPYLTISELNTLISVLKPEKKPKTILYPLYDQNAPPFICTLEGTGQDKSALHAQLESWTQTLQHSPEIEKSGWTLRVIRRATEHTTAPLYVTLLPPLAMGFVGGLLVGLLLLTLMWLGRMLPGGIGGCMATGVILGTALSTIPRLIQPTRYHAIGHVGFYKPGNQLTPQAREELIWALLVKSPNFSSLFAPSIGNLPVSPTNYTIGAMASEPDTARRFIVNWQNEIKLSRVTRLLGCEIGLSSVSVEQSNPRALLPQYALFGAGLGLALGLFMALTRRR